MVAVFHRIGVPSEDHYTHSIKQILDYKGLITFDGAYDSIWQYRRELAKREPILFVQGDTINNKGVLTLSQIIELQRLGFNLGWHGYSHRKLIDLSDKEIYTELESPKEFRSYYAYPHGEFSEHTKKLVQSKGFMKAYSTTQGDDSDYAITREYI